MNSLLSYLTMPTAKTVSQAAEELYSIAGLGPIDKASNTYNECKSQISAIIYNYLDFDRFKAEDGCFSRVIPDGLGIEVAGVIEAEYKAFLDQLPFHELINDAETSTLQRMESYAWRNGINILPEAIQQMIRNLVRTADQYTRMQESVDDSSLKKSFKDASACTLIESITGTNDNDVLVYRQDLIEYLEKRLANLMYSFFERFFNVLSCSTVFTDMETRFLSLIEYAKGQQTDSESIADLIIPDDYLNGEHQVFTTSEEKTPEEIIASIASVIGR